MRVYNMNAQGSTRAKKKQGTCSLLLLLQRNLAHVLAAVVESWRCRQLFTVRAPRLVEIMACLGQMTDAQLKEWISGLPHYQKERLHFFLAADSPGLCTAEERALCSFSCSCFFV